MILRNALIIGLYRYQEENNHFYVYTKPRLSTLVRETDKVGDLLYNPPKRGANGPEMYIFVRNQRK